MNLFPDIFSAVVLDPNGLRVRLMQVDNQPILPPITTASATAGGADADSPNPGHGHSHSRSSGSAVAGDGGDGDGGSRARGPTARLGYVSVPVASARRFGQVAAFYDALALPAHARPSASAAAAAAGGAGAALPFSALPLTTAGGAGSAAGATSSMSAGSSAGSSSSSVGRASRHLREVDAEHVADALTAFLWLGNGPRARRPALCLVHKATRSGTGAATTALSSAAAASTPAAAALGDGESGAGAGAGGEDSESSAVTVAAVSHPVFLGVSCLVHSITAAAAQLRTVEGLAGARLEPAAAAHGLPRCVSFIDPVRDAACAACLATLRSLPDLFVGVDCDMLSRLLNVCFM